MSRPQAFPDAAAPPRVIANEISVQPVGEESAARNIASNVDDAIEKNYKAALISKGLDRESIRFNAKNGVITLKGHVKSPQTKQEAQQIATNIPNVQQVLNELEVRRWQVRCLAEAGSSDPAYSVCAVLIS